MSVFPPLKDLDLGNIQALRELINNDPSVGWNEAWNQKITPWDVGHTQPPLRDLLESNELPLPRSGKALVPGCGRGVDAILIAEKLGLQTLALDISPLAVEIAKETLAATPGGPLDKCSFATEDFFSLSADSENDKFDLIYDYTFFVAIHPSRRVDWSTQMAKLTKPGGYLVTLVFPIGPPQEEGPPYFVQPEDYVKVLEASKWEKVLDKVPEVSTDFNAGRERLVVWKRV